MMIMMMIMVSVLKNPSVHNDDDGGDGQTIFTLNLMTVF